MATNTWMLDSGGLWSDTTNWLSVAVPVASDQVGIDQPGSYTVTVDIAAVAASIMLAEGVTLAIAPTAGLSVGGSVSTTPGAVVDLAGLLAAGTLDLTGGGTLAADGGTLDAAATVLLGQTSDIAGPGTITNLGTVGWTGSAFTSVTISNNSFLNSGSLELGAIAQSETLSNVPTGTTSGRFGLQAVDGTLFWTHENAATLTIAGQDFSNSGVLNGVGGTLDITGPSFVNTGTILLQSVSSENVQTTNAAPNITIDVIVTTELLGQLNVGANVLTFVNTGIINAGTDGNILFAQPTFDNAGTINAGSITFDQTTLTNTGSINVGNVVFTQPITLSQIGAISGNLSFDAGVNLEGGTLTAGTLSVAGLVQNGTIAGTGTLTLEPGTTLDNVAISPGITLVEPGGTGSPSISVIDPPPTATVTLDAAITNVTFSNVGSFDGTIALGANASTNDAVRLLTPGGVTLGPAFALASAGNANGVTFANGSTELTNQGNWAVNGISVEVASTLGGVGTFSLDSGGSLSLASYTGAGTFNASNTSDVTVESLSGTGATFNLSSAAAATVTSLSGASTFNLDSGAIVSVKSLSGTGATFSLNNGAVLNVASLDPAATPSVAFGAGTSQLTLAGTNSLGVLLSGLQAGDAVDFKSVSSGPNSFGVFGTPGVNVSGGTLNLQGSSGDQASVGVASATSGLNFTIESDGSGGTTLVVACFAEGTRIATETGEARVETLRPGDLVRTASGRIAPVRWVGHTRVNAARHPRPHDVLPVRVRAGATGPGQPARDLLLSPDHALLLGGMLIPVRYLLNGVTIAQEAAEQVTYWHVELDRHDVLLAEGLPAESFLDTGNRALFAGETGVRPLHPDFRTPPGVAAQMVWEAMGCARLCLAGPEVEAARAALRRRAQAVARSVAARRRRATASS